MKDKPVISVITPSLNHGSDLENTIISFISQDYLKKELLVIDGGSKDNTKEIIRKYQKYIDYWVSEPDKGISDAFNKGVKAAKGDYLYFMGAGDFFWSKDILQKMMQGINPEIDILVCGRINRIAEKGDQVLYTSGINFHKWQLLYKMGLPHQALFMNKRYFYKYGLFDIKCKFAMDYDLLLRSYKIFPAVVLKDIIVAAWREGGVGKDKTLQIYDEYKKIRLKNHIAPAMLINIIDFLSRMKYFTGKIFIG